MKILSIDRDNFNKFLENLSGEFDVYAPVKFFDPQAGDKTYFHFKRFNPDLVDKIVVGGIRASEPIKSFLAYSRERVDAVPEKKQVLVGIKACDIQSLPIQDFVFMNNDPKDPFYTAKREGTYIISSDCDLLYESCFCTAAGNVPYPGGGFDLNLSASARGYLVEVGSDKGRELIKKNENFFTNAEEREVGHRNNQRREFTDSLRSQVDEKEVPGFSFLKGKMKEKYPDSKLWEETAKTCIECGACNFACPTCHCFFVSDQKKDNLTARFKSWDACLYRRFAVVAGGANPRKHLAERLRNRFDKKFDFFPTVLDKYACTGCGRCYDGCPGKIDIREVLKKLVK